jgi:hypothetical protein
MEQIFIACVKEFHLFGIRLGCFADSSFFQNSIFADSLSESGCLLTVDFRSCYPFC